MMGLGTDILEIARVERALENPGFARRVFTPAEREWLEARGKNRAQSAAGLFCAKEAVAKALGTGFRGGLGLTDVEIGHTAAGAPVVLRPAGRFLLSITHCREYAAATAVLLERTEEERRADD